MLILSILLPTISLLAIFGCIYFNNWLKEFCKYLILPPLVAILTIGLTKNHNTQIIEPIVDTVFVYPSLNDRALLVLSIMSVESNFNPTATGKEGDTGILQIRQIYVDEVNRLLGYQKYNLLDAYDIDCSLEMFDILQNNYNPNNDFIQTIYYHNKSSLYKDKVIREYNQLLLYERMRERLINRY